MKPKNISHTIFFLISIALLTFCGITLFCLPQHDYSENENRYLTTFQTPSVTSFFNTSMQKNLTDGANDQFIGRDIWMKFATALQHAIGFQNIGGVYLGKNGYYFERILDSQLSETRYLNNLRYLEQFAQTYDTASLFLPVPSKSSILEEYLPKNAVLYNSDKLFSQAKKQLQYTSILDIRSILMKEKEKKQLYFKTDHHWTMNASYIAYTAFCKMHGITAVPLSQFAPECVSQHFLGTLYSKAPEFHVNPDYFLLPAKVADANIWIDAKQASSIYDENKLNTKDKYGVYFGGNFGQITIHTKNNNSQKTLLIIKDSFANSIIPFLMENYHTIIMIDLRYYNLPISELILKTQPDETLFLYEISNFAQDVNFFKILK